MGTARPLYKTQSAINLSIMMMKLILALTLLVAVTIAAPGSPHDKLIADYCAADDAGKDAILVGLEGWCLTAGENPETKAFCDEISTSFAEVGFDKNVFRQGLADGVC